MTNYERGKRFEDKVKGALEKDGYFVARAGGSRGVADLLALKIGQSLLIQCKKTDPLLSPADRAELITKANLCGGLPIVAYQPAPRKPIAYRRLLGNGPKDWISWHPDEVLENIR